MTISQSPVSGPLGRVDEHWVGLFSSRLLLPFIRINISTRVPGVNINSEGNVVEIMVSVYAAWNQILLFHKSGGISFCGSISRRLE
jgi:hypothetical protein